MGKLEFRNLRADEIDCRINMIRDDGLSLLLYKDARVDMNILDETVGAMNWKKSYSRDNANCTVSLWDEDKKDWVSKEDTGKESFSEAEKGLASDSFKRACFNWGIGRALYTAPFIWIDGHYKKNEKGKYECYERFHVESIHYSENGTIDGLEIANSKTRKIVFAYGYNTKKSENKIHELKAESQIDGSAKIGNAEVAKILDEMKRTGITERTLLYTYKVNSFEELTFEQYADMMRIFKNTKDKEVK